MILALEHVGNVCIWRATADGPLRRNRLYERGYIFKHQLIAGIFSYPINYPQGNLILGHHVLECLPQKLSLGQDIVLYGELTHAIPPIVAQSDAASLPWPGG